MSLAIREFNLEVQLEYRKRRLSVVAPFSFTRGFSRVIRLPSEIRKPF
jgi:hypothetical protein